GRGPPGPGTGPAPRIPWPARTRGGPPPGLGAWGIGPRRGPDPAVFAARCAGRIFRARISPLWVVSSVVEHCLHTAGVTSSNLVPPTRISKDKNDGFAPAFFVSFAISGIEPYQTNQPCPAQSIHARQTILRSSVRTTL